MLIVVSGLPGTGKTTVAAALARRLDAAHLSVDVMENALRRAGLPAGWTTGVAAYEVTGAAAEQLLAVGQDVVVDAVNDSDAARQTWRDAAERTAARLKFLMLTCSDDAEHNRRLQGRERGLPHIPEPTWDQVVLRASVYEPWTDLCPVVDTRAALESVVDEAHRRLGDDL